jgi:uncharacterized protein
MKKYFLIPALIMGFNLGALESTDSTSSTKTGEFVWNELATINVQGAKDFYSKVFGWEFIEKKMDDVTYTIIKKGDKEFGGIWAIPGAQQNQIRPHWLSYILVENVEQSLELARQNGAVIVKPVHKIGEIGLFAIVRDPTGAHVALWQSLKK